MRKNKDELFNRVENPYRITEPQMNACSSMDCTGSVPAAPASEEELEVNPRSRSAKLRVCEKI